MSVIDLIKLEVIPEDMGGGWMASIPALGEWTFLGDGETPEEAIEHLREVFDLFFEESKEHRLKEIHL